MSITDSSIQTKPYESSEAPDTVTCAEFGTPLSSVAGDEQRCAVCAAPVTDDAGDGGGGP